MPRRSDDIDGSWVVDGAAQMGAGWRDEDTSSDFAEDAFPKPAKAARRLRGRRVPPTAGPTEASASPEPELIMPSVDASFGNVRHRSVPVRKSPPSRSARSTESPKTPKQRVKGASMDEQNNRAMEIASAGAEWLLGIFGQTLRMLQKPIAVLLACYLVLVAVQLGHNLLTQSVYNALSPICRVPGIGLLNLAICRPYGANYPKLPSGSNAPDPEFEALMKAQSQFEAIVSDTAASASLPMDMKRSEISIRDLRQLVKFSQLPSKHELEHELDGFVETARIASYDLQKFDSHVGRSVDKVLSTNKWTRRVLDEIDLKRSERGIVPAFIADTILAPFQPVKFTENRLLDQYIQHSHIVSGEIETLIDEAQALLQVLQNLEDRLDVMHSITTHDNIQIQGSKEEVLRELWSYIGMNRAKLGKHDNQLRLLSMVSGYRRAALNHVTRTLVHLQSMGSEIEELRDRVAQPGLMRDAGVKQIPLSVHIDNIQLGVERLEAGREKAKELQQKHTRRILDKAQGNSEEDVKYISSG